MAGLLSLPHIEDAVGTEVDAETALNADHGFVDLAVPEDGPHHACIHTTAAPGALLLGKVDPSLFGPRKRVHGAGSDTRGILADPAGHNGEPVFHTAAGSDPYTRLRQPVAVRPPRAREHAALAANTPFRVNNRQSFHSQTPPGGTFLYIIRFNSRFGRELTVKWVFSCSCNLVSEHFGKYQSLEPGSRSRYKAPGTRYCFSIIIHTPAPMIYKKKPRRRYYQRGFLWSLAKRLRHSECWLPGGLWDRL